MSFYAEQLADVWLNREESRAVDRMAIQQWGVSSLVLMENAGRGIADFLCAQGKLTTNDRVVICCAKGNNGGDGFVVARHLHLRGIAVEVWMAAVPSELRGDGLCNYQILRRVAVPVHLLAAESGNENADAQCKATDEVTTASTKAAMERSLSTATWVVDAMLGTGSHGEPREPLATIIRCINQVARRTLAVDLPSGLDCQTGYANVPTIRATQTCTLAAQKLGFQDPKAAEYLGTVHVLDIGLPAEFVRQCTQRPPQGNVDPRD